jgi:2-polyprenyl-6-methoxyphenol hydroxylase-like FAD-dependent oxidoreductase
MRKGIIIGAGIGGLTTAIALAKKGIDADVYEQADRIKEVGAGIWVAPNGLKIYEKLGIVGDITSAGQTLEKISVVDLNLRPMSTVDGSKVRAKHKYSTLAIHRAALQKILASYVPESRIALGKKLKSYRQTEHSIVAEFEDGTSAEADFLINATGIRSIARERIEPSSTLRYSGQTCWRYVTKFDLPEAAASEMYEIWGEQKGLRAAYSKIGDAQVYGYITNYQPAGGTDDRQTVKEDLLNLCADFPPIVRDLIRSCDADAIIRTDLFDFKPIRQWTDGRLALIGDAAHATTPNLGQGACQAIEDAYVIADELHSNADVGEAFKNYQSKRIKKATYITNLSWQFAQLTNTSGLKKSLVENIIRMTPDFIADRQLDKIYAIED